MLNKEVMSLFLAICSFGVCMSDQLNGTQFRQKSPFSYDLGIKVIPAKTKNRTITICCHGYGHNSEIVESVAAAQAVPGTLIGFNFPDYNITEIQDHHKTAFGTIHEIVPLLYMIHYVVCTLKTSSINLYGFSAGGGAVINALAILHKNLYQKELAGIGISHQDIKQMLQAIEKGQIILECPLKSVKEILALRGTDKNLAIMQQRYEQNAMNPIDALELLEGLKLNILLYFETPDDILGNRDDELFIARLKQANKGQTHVVVATAGGHNAYHARLWECYKKFYA